MRTLTREHQHVSEISERQARRKAATAAVRSIAPLVVGLTPLALTVGTAAAQARLPPLVGWISSAFLYGGSGQLTWIQMLHSGAPAALVVGATLMVNVQMLMYGAAMRTYWAGESRHWRVAAAQLLVSPVFGVAMAHHQTEPDPALRKVFYMTSGITLWTAWLALTGIGYACGGLPSSMPVMTVLTPLVMVSLAVRAVHDVGTMTALIIAAAAAVLCLDVPYDLGFVAAAVAGVAAGAAVELAIRGGRSLAPVNRQ